MKAICTIWMVLLMASVLHLPAEAQMTLSNSVICTGAGEPANATSSLWCTVGQPAVGTMGDSTYSTGTGFWYQPDCTFAGMEGLGGEALTRCWFGPSSPNPFKTATTIRFSVPGRCHVSLKVYDVTGRQVRALLVGEVGPGHHSVDFDATGLASGLYFCRMVTGRFAETRKLVLLK